MDVNDENKGKTVEELAEMLKEIYNAMKNHTMRQSDITIRYEMSPYAVKDLKDIDKGYLDPDNLKDVVDLLKTEEKVFLVGAKLGIGNNILAFIRKSMHIEDKTMSDNDEERSIKLQELWQRFSKGERIEKICADMNLNINHAEKLMYDYSDLVERMKSYYKRSNTNRKGYVLQSLKRRYYLNDEMLECIKNNRSNSEEMEKFLQNYIKREGIGERNIEEVGDTEGGENEL